MTMHTTLETPAAAAPEPYDAPLPRNCTFPESDWRILANYWYPIAVADKVKDAPVAATLLDQRLVLYRTSSGVTVANNLCLHRGVPLTMGWCENNQIVCKYHGFHYDAACQCVAIPARPFRPSSSSTPTPCRKSTG